MTRDLDQAKAAAIIATQYLRLSFDGQELDGLTKALRELAPQLIAAARPG